MTSLPFHANPTTTSDFPSTVPLRDASSIDSMEELMNSERTSWRGAWRGWKVIVLASWCNLLLIFVPVVWALGVTTPHFTALIFIFCILALIPLVRLHDLLIQFLAENIGGSKAGLLNATLSNIIEVIIAVIALRKCELRFVHTTLIGSVLSRLLLVLGLSLLSGGVKFREQRFSTTTATAHTSLLSMSTGAILLPAAYHFVLANDLSDTSSDWQKRNILKMSRVVSVILIVLYGFYLTFQLWSHEQAYEDCIQSGTLHTVTVRKPKILQRSKPLFRGDRRGSSAHSQPPYHTLVQPVSRNASSDSAHSSATLASVELENFERPNNELMTGFEGQSRCNPELYSGTVGTVERAQNNQSTAVEFNVPSSTKVGGALNAFSLLLIIGAVTSVVDFLIESLDGLSNRISTAWIGLVVLPTIRVIAECVIVINLSAKGRVSTSVSVIIGSTIQTALFVVPLMVLLGWAMEKPLGLLFDPFESIILFISVQTIGLVLSDGESNWLDGVILLALYAIIASAFWFYPAVGASLSSSLGVCYSNN